MNSKILILKNISHENPGLIQEVLESSHIGYDVVDLAKGEKWLPISNYQAVIVLGGPASANDATSLMQEEIRQVRDLLNQKTPYLGICLGMQVLAKAVDAEVTQNAVKEIGFFNSEGRPYQIHVAKGAEQDPLFEGLGSSFRVFQLHAETVTLNPQLQLLATGEHCRNQIIKAGTSAYGIQCHFELTREMLEVWQEKDADLKLLDKKMLLQHYDGLSQNYQKTGKALIHNFLKLASLLI